MQRSACICLATFCIIMVSFSGSLSGQTIDLALDLYFSDPADTNSSGEWQLVGTAADRGISGIFANLVDVNPSPTLEAPTGSGTGVAAAGFRETFDGGNTPFWTDQGDHLELSIVQLASPAGTAQGLFYDVGVPGGATQPGENGTPAIPGFLAGNNVPWNFTDTLGDLLDDGTENGSGPFEGGVHLARGTFDANSSPGFFTGIATSATIYLNLATATDPPGIGDVLPATVTTRIRDNTSLSGGGFTDYDDSGTWDLGDLNLVLFNWQVDETSLPASWVNQRPDAGMVVGLDELNQVLFSWQQPASLAVVPEPATALCTSLGVLAVFWFNRRRY